MSSKTITRADLVEVTHSEARKSVLIAVVHKVVVGTQLKWCQPHDRHAGQVIQFLR